MYIDIEYNFKQCNNKQQNLNLIYVSNLCFYQCSHSKGRLGAQDNYAIYNINQFRNKSLPLAYKNLHSIKL